MKSSREKDKVFYKMKTYRIATEYLVKTTGSIKLLRNVCTRIRKIILDLLLVFYELL